MWCDDHKSLSQRDEVQFPRELQRRETDREFFPNESYRGLEQSRRFLSFAFPLPINQTQRIVGITQIFLQSKQCSNSSHISSNLTSHRHTDPRVEKKVLPEPDCKLEKKLTRILDVYSIKKEPGALFQISPLPPPIAERRRNRFEFQDCHLFLRHEISPHRVRRCVVLCYS